jgi:hypothetical protein
VYSHLQAFECELCGIKPSPLKSAHGKWSKEAKDTFRILVDEDAKFFGSVGCRFPTLPTYFTILFSGLFGCS